MDIIWKTVGLGKYADYTFPWIALNAPGYLCWVITQMERFNWSPELKAQALHTYECMRSIIPPTCFDNEPTLVAYFVEQESQNFSDAAFVKAEAQASRAGCFTHYYPAFDLALPCEYNGWDEAGARYLRDLVFDTLGYSKDDHEFEQWFCEEYFSEPSHFFYNEHMLFPESGPSIPEPIPMEVSRPKAAACARPACNASQPVGDALASASELPTAQASAR